MALEDVIPQGLEALIMDPAALRALEEQLVGRVQGDIQREAGNRVQQTGEHFFSRGLGLSDLHKQAQAENERVRAEALAKARIDASNAARQAQLSALANAAQYVTAGQNRQQQASQFDRTMAQRSKESKQSRELGENQMLMGGLAGLGGGALQTAGLLYGKEIKGALKDLFGGGAPGGAPGLPTNVPLPALPNLNAPLESAFSEMPSFNQGVESDFLATAPLDLSSLAFGGDFDFGGVSVPDFGFSIDDILSAFNFGNEAMDLSGLV